MQVVANILSKGIKLRDYTKTVEKNLREGELDSIQVCVVLIACSGNLFVSVISSPLDWHC